MYITQSDIFWTSFLFSGEGCAPWWYFHESNFAWFWSIWLWKSSCWYCSLFATWWLNMTRDDRGEDQLRASEWCMSLVRSARDIGLLLKSPPSSLAYHLRKSLGPWYLTLCPVDLLILWTSRGWTIFRCRCSGHLKIVSRTCFGVDVALSLAG